MSQCTVDSLRAVIAAHGGLLRRGAHSNKDECCVLEARSVCIGIPWTDSPKATGMPDIRPLNDAGWSSDEVRTEAMIALAAAFDDWATWAPERQLQWGQRITLRTTREILPIVLDGLIDVTLVDACRNATTLTEAANAAAEAAGAAWAAKATWAAWAAEAAEAAWAAWTARAARAAEAAAGDTILHLACRIWIEEAHALATA